MGDALMRIIDHYSEMVGGWPVAPAQQDIAPDRRIGHGGHRRRCRRGKALFGNLADAELLQGRVHIKADRHVLGHVIGTVGAIARAKGIVRAAVRIAAPGDALGLQSVQGTGDLRARGGRRIGKALRIEPAQHRVIGVQVV
jgi:hypothetical protein